MFSLTLTLIIALFSCNETANNTANAANLALVAKRDSAVAAAKKDSLALVARIDSLKAKRVYDSTTKVIYLTFDDGPLAETPYLVQIVQEKNIKMTAFVVGKHARANKTFMERLEEMKRNPLFEVVNHSHSHANGRYKNFYSSPQGAADDMIGNESALGLTKRIIRMPGRDIWALNKRTYNTKDNGGKTALILRDAGFRVFGWDCEWERVGGRATPKYSAQHNIDLVQNLLNERKTLVPNNLVMLAHDNMLNTEKGRNDLRTIIDAFKAKGYVFEFISNYPD
jgi:peptidoglycan-N-acetylglucosamine deacetylase